MAEPLKPEDIATALRHLAADWYADAMRLPPSAESEARSKLSGELEDFAGCVLAGDLRRTADGSLAPQSAKETALEDKIDEILDGLADEVLEDGRNGAANACSSARDDIMRAVRRLVSRPPAELQLEQSPKSSKRSARR